jgi:hypothetical protein
MLVVSRREDPALNRQCIHSNTLGFAAVCAMACVLAGGIAAAHADVRMEFRETTWSVRAQPPEQSSVLRSWISGGKRRVETEALPPPSAQNPPPQMYYAQIDRIDLDTSYVVLPRDSLYGAVPFERSRDANRETLGTLVAARSAGTGPADTLAPVRVTPLERPRTFFGVECRAYELELKFEYRDSIPGSPGLRTQGVLTDTVWIAPPDSPFGEAARFEQEFAHATLADSFLAGANAVELSQTRGQGLISVLRREARKLPGYLVASRYRNVILGLPKGMSGVERTPDGAVVVQRAVREPTGLATAEIDDAVFEIPPGYRRDVAGEDEGGGGRR